MILDSPENLTSIEISRPVTDGMVKFLSKVRKHGARIFGDETLALSQEDIPNKPGLTKVTGAGLPRLSLYQPADLRLTIFERRAIAAMRLHGSFRHALGKFESDADPYSELSFSSPRRPTSVSDKSLQATMSRIGYKYGVADQSNVSVMCDNIAPKADGVHDPRNGHELSLIPAFETPEAAMLIDQAGLCMRALAHYGRKSAYPMAPNIINVPFGRLPQDVSEEERHEFITDVKSLLPVEIALGAITTRVSRQH